MTAEFCWERRLKSGPVKTGPTGPLPTALALATLISIQHAEGYWPHKPWLDKVLKEKSEAHAQFPEEVSSEIWATVVALALLEHDYCDDTAEWELVAEKANKWLESQKLDVSLSSLKQTAFSCLGKI